MKHAFSFFLLALFLACCTPMDMYTGAPLEYTVLRQENSGFYDFDKFLAEQLEKVENANMSSLIKGVANLLVFLDKSLTFRIAALEYATVDPNGNPVMASGLVFHPMNRKSKGVVDLLPLARVGDNGASAEFYASEGLIALSGYTVILPDLLGFGVSKETTKSPFLMTENTGRVAYDMRRAAAKYLWDEFGYALPAETIIVGYSLGGSAALATQKYYETYHARTVKIKEVHAGGGAYDLTAAFDTFSKTGYSDYPAVPNVILAFKHYYFDYFGKELALEKVFTGELLANYSDWYSGKYPPDKIIEMLGSDIHAYMHKDFFKPFEQQNSEFKKLHPYLKENSVSDGWKPQAPIYLIHSNNDTYVPTACAEVAVKKFRRAGAKISYTTYPGTHGSVGILFILKAIIHLS